jgi:hypothetical protein
VNVDDVHERLRQCPRQIRVLCPRGHFIANVLLGADDELTHMRPQPSNRAPTLTFDEFAARLAGDFSADDRRAYHGWVDVYDAGGHRVRTQCRKCGYSRRLDARRLAVELAVYALAGHSEHRLTA